MIKIKDNRVKHTYFNYKLQLFSYQIVIRGKMGTRMKKSSSIHICKILDPSIIIVNTDNIFCVFTPCYNDMTFKLNAAGIPLIHIMQLKNSINFGCHHLVEYFKENPAILPDSETNSDVELE